MPEKVIKRGVTILLWCEKASMNSSDVRKYGNVEADLCWISNATHLPLGSTSFRGLSPGVLLGRSY